MIDFDNIRQQFESYLTEGNIGVPVEYENVPEDSNLVLAKRNNNNWCRVSLRTGEGVSASVGVNNFKTYTGIIIISFFIRTQQGTKDFYELSENLSNSILSQNFNFLLLRTPFTNIIGNVDNWFQGNLTIPFESNQF